MNPTILTSVCRICCVLQTICERSKKITNNSRAERRVSWKCCESRGKRRRNARESVYNAREKDEGSGDDSVVYNLVALTAFPRIVWKQLRWSLKIPRICNSPRGWGEIVFTALENLNFVEIVFSLAKRFIFNSFTIPVSIHVPRVTRGNSSQAFPPFAFGNISSVRYNFAKPVKKLWKTEGRLDLPDAVLSNFRLFKYVARSFYLLM